MTWVIWFRVLFLGVIFGASLFFEWTTDVQISWMVFVVCIGGMLFSALSNLALQQHWWSATSMGWIQVLVDLSISSFFVWMTGGAQSGFLLLYALNLMGSGILLLSRGCLVSTLLTAGIVFCFVAFGGSNTLSRDWIPMILQPSVVLLLGSLLTVLFRNREQMMRTLDRTSRHLEDLHQIHSAIVGHMPSGVVLINQAGEILYQNPAAERALSDLPALMNLSHSPLECMLTQMESEVICGSKHLRAEKVLLPDQKYLILLSDISEQRQLESSIRTKEKLASVGQLAAGLAHEIKNPLASLSGSIQLLKNEMDPEPTHDRLMQIVLRETDRLDELLTNFLSYAKPAQLSLEPVRYHQMIGEIISLVRNSVETSKREFIEIKNDVDEDAVSTADPGKMKQVFWNLIKNAMAAISERGSITLRSARQSYEGEDYLRISIKDTGVGISSDDLNRVFEPFFTKKTLGSGLGLAVVYQSIRIHEGRIGVESELGKGTEFWFEIPVQGPKQRRENFAAA
jgi:two-component system sensor histidine kinase PilS (NtrC family)